MADFDLFRGLRIASSGLSAERARVDVIAENVANARTTRTAEGGPYRRKLVVFEPMFRRALGEATPVGVETPRVVPDLQTPFERVFDPGHPHADAEGYVSLPNVNAVLEMADLVSAVRAYEANLSVQEGISHMAERALQLAR